MSDDYILVVDDEPDIHHLVQEILEDEGYTVSVAGSAESAREVIKEQSPKLVLLDIWMPGEDGVTLLKSLKKEGLLSFPVVMMSGHGTVETAVEATLHGAIDFIEKPLSLAKLLLTVEKALQYKMTADNGGQTEAPPPVSDIVGKGIATQKLKKLIEEVGSSTQHVCVYGPSASGKLLVARHLHAASSRATQSCIQLRCDSLSRVNSARELLGDVENGSRLNGGYLDAADNGTLILADAQYLPEVAQSLILDILAGREVGDSQRRFDIRFISTMDAEMLEGSDKQGVLNITLQQQLCAHQIECLSLSKRAEDIPVLLDHYINWFVETEGLPYRHFSVAAQNRLRNHPWPGNILELKNFVQRLMILGNGVEIDIDEVSIALGGQGADSLSSIDGLGSISLDLPLREARTEFEKVYMLYQLQKVDGNIGELAKHVGMERTHLYRKLRGLEIDLGKMRD